MDSELDLFQVIKDQQPRDSSIQYWTVQEFLEFYEVLKLAGIYEIYYDADPSFRRIANRLYNLFGKE